MRRSPTWIAIEQPIGRAWALEYAMFCLGLSLASAGAIAGAYQAGIERAPIVREMSDDVVTLVRQRCETERIRK